MGANPTNMGIEMGVLGRFMATFIIKSTVMGTKVVFF